MCGVREHSSQLRKIYVDIEYIAWNLTILNKILSIEVWTVKYRFKNELAEIEVFWGSLLVEGLGQEGWAICKLKSDPRG